MLLTWMDRSPSLTVAGPLIATSLPEREAAALREMATGKRVLEIGAAFGFSTCVMGLVARGVVSVDPHDVLDSLPTLKRNLLAYGIEERVTIVPGLSHEVCGSLPDAWFDLAFVDADHSETACRQDIEACLRLVKAGGQLAFHDWQEDTCPEVTAALKAFFPDGPNELIDTLFIVNR